MIHIQDISDSVENPVCNRACQPVWKEASPTRAAAAKQILLNSLFGNKQPQPPQNVTPKPICTTVTRRETYW